MVVPFVADFIFDYTKLTITEPKCLVMSTDSKLVAYLDSAYYGDNAITIVDRNTNPGKRVIFAEQSLAFNHSSVTNNDFAFDFKT